MPKGERTARSPFVLEPFDDDKPAAVEIARRLVRCGFGIVATSGTATFLERAGLRVERANKVREGSPRSVDALHRGEIAMVNNTPEGAAASMDSFSIGRTALERQVPLRQTKAPPRSAAKAHRQD